MSDLINSVKNNTLQSFKPENKYKEKYQKIIKEKYDRQYKDDMAKHKTGFIMLITFAITGLLSFCCCKEERGLTGLMGFGSLIGLFFAPILKPKKEKYDAAMKKELDEVI